MLVALQCLGTLGVLFTLIFVAQQAREAAKAAIGSPYDRVANQMFAMDRVFIDYPHMRPYFFDGQAIGVDDEDYQRAVSIAEFRLDFLDQVIQQSRLFPDDWDLTRWRRHIVWSLARSPVMRNHLAELRFTYSEEMLACLSDAKALAVGVRVEQAHQADAPRQASSQ